MYFFSIKLLLHSISTSIHLVFYSNYSLIISEIIHNYYMYILVKVLLIICLLYIISKFHCNITNMLLLENTLSKVKMIKISDCCFNFASQICRYSQNSDIPTCKLPHGKKYSEPAAVLG